MGLPVFVTNTPNRNKAVAPIHEPRECYVVPNFGFLVCRSVHRFARLCVVTLGLSCAGSTVSLSARALVRITTASHFQRVSSTPHPTLGYRIEGQLADDRGKPVRGVSTELVSSRTAHPCEPQAHKTDDNGSFCWVTEEPTPLLRFAGNTYVQPTSLKVPERSWKAPQLTLGVRSGQKLILDEGPFELEVSVATTPQEVAAVIPKKTDSVSVGLRLHRDGVGVSLGAHQDVSTERPATFLVNSEALGAPGLVELQAFTAGGLTDQVARKTIHLVRKVTIAVPQADADGVLHEMSPSEGFELRVPVTRNGFQPVDGGWVEISSDGSRIATAAVVDGIAALSLQFEVHGDGPIPLQVTFLAGDSHFVGGQATRLLLNPPTAPSWSSIVLTIALLACLGWVLRNWWRPLRRSVPNDKGLERVPVGVEHVRGSRNGPGRWTGHVYDTHTGAPIVTALVQVSKPTLHTFAVLAESHTANDGSFSLELTNASEGSVLTVKANRYSLLRRNVPQAGHLRIGVTRRRRTILDHLVTWSNRHQVHDVVPTPLGVRRHALKMGNEEVAAWAEQVELAAFGPHEPTENDEARLQEATPARRQGAPDRR